VLRTDGRSKTADELYRQQIMQHFCQCSGILTLSPLQGKAMGSSEHICICCLPWWSLQSSWAQSGL